MRRQVRVQGVVKKINAEQADNYFRTRSKESQIGAWASPQSEVICSRADLEQRIQIIASKYQDGETPRPPFWGGFRLFPDRIEFWQECPNRLHDRFRYRRSGEGEWILERLAP
jgi:pyridoxamine 5'-phosphate oxidase